MSVIRSFIMDSALYKYYNTIQNNELGQFGIAFLHSIWDMLNTHKKCFHKTHEPINQLLKTYTELIFFDS